MATMDSLFAEKLPNSLLFIAFFALIEPILLHFSFAPELCLGLYLT